MRGFKSLHLRQYETHPSGCFSYWRRWRDLNRSNATVRRTVACRRLDGGNTINFISKEMKLQIKFLHLYNFLHPLGCFFLLAGWNGDLKRSNTTVRRTVACRRLIPVRLLILFDMTKRLLVEATCAFLQSPSNRQLKECSFVNDVRP